MTTSTGKAARSRRNPRTCQVWPVVKCRARAGAAPSPSSSRLSSANPHAHSGSSRARASSSGVRRRYAPFMLMGGSLRSGPDSPAVTAGP